MRLDPQSNDKRRLQTRKTSVDIRGRIVVNRCRGSASKLQE
jgi:hypothetical protein